MSELNRLVEYARRENISVVNPRTSSGGPQPPLEPSKTRPLVHPAPKTRREGVSGDSGNMFAFLEARNQNQLRRYS